MSRWLCGTPFLQELDKGIENYHKGIPISERVIIKELEVFIPRDRRRVADLVSPYGEEIIDSQVEIEGMDGECPIYNPEVIRGFFPEEGHEYLIKVRLFKLKTAWSFYRYELVDIIKDIFNDYEAD